MLDRETLRRGNRRTTRNTLCVCACPRPSSLLARPACRMEGLSMAWGMGSLNIFFALSFFFLCFVGDYDKAVESVKEVRMELVPSLPKDDNGNELI